MRKAHCHHFIPHVRTGALRGKNQPEVTPEVVEQGFKLRSYYNIGLLTDEITLLLTVLGALS